MWTWLLFVSRSTAARCQLTGEQLEQASATYAQSDTEHYDMGKRCHDEFRSAGLGDCFDERQPKA